MNHQNPSRLYLLRHAKSSWTLPSERDFARTLDDEGFAQAEIVADKAADRNYRPDRVVSSTAVRCRQTAEAIRRAMDHEMELFFTDTLYRSEEHTSELQSLMSISYAVFCLETTLQFP